MSQAASGGMAAASAAHGAWTTWRACPKEAAKPCRTEQAVLSATTEQQDGGNGQRDEPDEAVPTPPKDQGGPGFDRRVGASKPEGLAAPVAEQDDASSASVHDQDPAAAASKAALHHMPAAPAGDAAGTTSPALSGLQLVSHRQALECVMAAEQEVAACKAALRALCAEPQAALPATAPAPCITAGAAGPPADETPTLSSNSMPAATTSHASAPFWPPPLARASPREPLDLTGMLSAAAAGVPPPTWQTDACLPAPAPASIPASSTSGPPPSTEPSFSGSWLGDGPLWTTTRPAVLAPGAPWPDSVTPSLGDGSLLSLATTGTAGCKGTWSFSPAAPATPACTESSVLTATAARVDASQKQLQAVHSALVAQIVRLEQQLQQAVRGLQGLQQDVEAALASKAVSARQVEMLAQEVADLRTSNMSMRLLLQHQQQQREAAGF